jgi:lipoate-protein ligase B
MIKKKEANMVNICHPQWLGQIEYGAALNLQKELAARRAANEIPDILLLMEHPHTYTVGNDGHREHLLVNQEELARRNVAYHRVGRGGSVAYHGPGQLVCCPILSLKEMGLDYHGYLKLLESVIIHTLAAFKVRAFRERGQPGVWVCTGATIQQDSEWLQPDHSIAQIAAVGVRLDQNHITSHGFFININPDLGFFDLIVPRGLRSCQVTSLAEVLNRPVKIGSVMEPVIQSFCKVFEMEPASLEINSSKLAVSQVVVSH